MRIRALFLAACVAAASAAPAALAQEGGSAPLTGEAWNRAQLSDLAEVLGGAHYLRILCQGRGDQRWRDYMRGVIRREPRYGDMLTERFNSGYRDLEARYPVCDQTAQQAEDELRARGLRIANALQARHTAGPSAEPHE